MFKNQTNEVMMQELLSFLETSYTAYQATENARRMLLAAGFCELYEDGPWELAKGGRYFVTRGGSALAAFICGDAREGYKIAASHTDSPALKLKASPALAEGGVTRLNTESYGGGLYYSYFDRPLRLAGRVVREEWGALVSHPYVSDFFVTLPSLAIHLNRDANKSFSPDFQRDQPFLSLGTAQWDKIAGGAAAFDLYAVPAERPYLWGADNEFLSSPRIDNLVSVYASLASLTEGAEGMCVAACLDNEEVGSLTRQGAGGDFLSAVLKRIAAAQGLGAQEYAAALARSFCLSLDGAQGFHASYPEKYDPAERAYLGKGVALKLHAGAAYTTDALSAAAVRKLFALAGAPLQNFYNRSTMRSGSTLGAIGLSQATVLSADLGVPQLAMHSAVETMALSDAEALHKGLRSFWTHRVRVRSDRVEIG